MIAFNNWVKFPPFTVTSRLHGPCVGSSCHACTKREVAEFNWLSPAFIVGLLLVVAGTGLVRIMKEIR